MSDKRRQGRIMKAVVEYEDDRAYWTCRIYIDFTGFDQAFGNLILDKATADVFAEEVCATFGVPSLAALEGVSCFGLWCLGENNEPMEGIEGPTGSRFTITGYRRRHFPEKACPAFDIERGRLEGEIRWAQRRLTEAQNKLAALPDRWTEWDTAP